MLLEKPSRSPTAVDRAVTAEEWELGMPPVLSNRDHCHVFVAKKWRGILINWAIPMASSAAHKGKFSKISATENPFLSTVRFSRLL